jgi:hypothetical protein
MLTKKEWCVVVMAGCLAGLAVAAVVLAAWSLWLTRPVLFWQVVIVVLLAALCVMYKRAWRRRPRPELWACTRCGKLYTLDKLLAHRCQAKETGEAKGVRLTVYKPYQEAWMSGGDRQILDCPRHAHSAERGRP